MKITKLSWFVLLISYISLFVTSAPAIEVSGDVFGSWNPADNPYLVVGDIRVPPSQSLIIEPGCQIEFQGHYKFIVDSLAMLRAIGTESDSIIFTDEDTLTGWNGIRYNWADSSCEIAFCRFEWGRAADHYPDPSLANGGAINLFRGGLKVRNSHLHLCRAWEGYGGAIYAAEANLSVSESVLDSNTCGFGGSAIYATTSNVVVEKSLIFSDSTYYILGGELGGGAVGCIYSNVEICGNTITDNFCG
jgi:predicted outer membrane repeat protein